MVKRIAPFMEGYRRQALLAPLLVSLETVCELFLPLLMASIIDDGIQKGNMGVILRVGVLMLVVSALSLTFFLSRLEEPELEQFFQDFRSLTEEQDL